MRGSGVVWEIVGADSVFRSELAWGEPVGCLALGSDQLGIATASIYGRLGSGEKQMEGRGVTTL